MPTYRAVSTFFPISFALGSSCQVEKRGKGKLQSSQLQFRATFQYISPTFYMNQLNYVLSLDWLSV